MGIINTDLSYVVKCRACSAKNTFYLVREGVVSKETFDLFELDIRTRCSQPFFYHCFDCSPGNENYTIGDIISYSNPFS